MTDNDPTEKLEKQSDATPAPSETSDCSAACVRAPTAGWIREPVDASSFDDCSKKLEQVVSGEFMELVNFTPLLYKYMSRDLPDEPFAMTRELGWRGAQILYKTRELCDKHEAQMPTVKRSTCEYALLFLAGYGAAFAHTRLLCSLVLLKLLSNTDKLHRAREAIERNKMVLSVSCTLMLVSDAHFTVLQSVLYAMTCMGAWELLNFV